MSSNVCQSGDCGYMTCYQTTIGNQTTYACEGSGIYGPDPFMLGRQRWYIPAQYVVSKGGYIELSVNQGGSNWTVISNFVIDLPTVGIQWSPGPNSFYQGCNWYQSIIDYGPIFWTSCGTTACISFTSSPKPFTFQPGVDNEIAVGFQNAVGNIHYTLKVVFCPQGYSSSMQKSSNCIDMTNDQNANLGCYCCVPSTTSTVTPGSTCPNASPPSNICITDVSTGKQVCGQQNALTINTTVNSTVEVHVSIQGSLPSGCCWAEVFHFPPGFTGYDNRANVSIPPNGGDVKAMLGSGITTDTWFITPTAPGTYQIITMVCAGDCQQTYNSNICAYGPTIVLNVSTTTTSSSPPPGACSVAVNVASNPSGIPVSASPTSTTIPQSGSATIQFSAPSYWTSQGTTYQFQYWLINGQTYNTPNPTYTVTCQQAGQTITVNATAVYQAVSGAGAPSSPAPGTCTVIVSATSNPAGIPVSASPSTLTLSQGQQASIQLSAPQTYQLGNITYVFNYWWVNGQTYNTPTVSYPVSCTTPGTITVEAIANYYAQASPPSSPSFPTAISQIPWNYVIIGAIAIAGIAVLGWAIGQARKKGE
ncbi:MAG: hypothetical protein RQ842_03105 [Vulcanisaeta sp.]|nr:hypothetical protein [Vulcanisaeta sp.]